LFLENFIDSETVYTKKLVAGMITIPKVSILTHYEI
jgi:hypothetical protein